MTIIDANLLLYAYNADAPQQKACAQWLQELLAFIRISTNSRIWANPRSAKEAFAIVGEWLRQPGVVPLHPGPLHAEILERLVSDHGAAGPLVTDAVLAAFAMEHGALLASTDQDFRRFPELRWLNPLRT